MDETTPPGRIVFYGYLVFSPWSKSTMGIRSSNHVLIDSISIVEESGSPAFDA